MKSILSFALLVVLACGCRSGSPGTETVELDQPTVVDASCGQCLFAMKEKDGCDLAVRIDGKPYFVEGFTMDQFGDAHASDGMCRAVRKAKVTGRISGGRFIAKTFELAPQGH